MSTVLADEVLIAILHFFRADMKCDKFTADREILHNAFFELRQQDPDALAGIGFRERYLFHESAALDQALSNLEATGLLERKNEAPRWYFLSDELDEAFNHNVRPSLEKSRIKPERFKPLAKSFAKMERVGK